MNRQGERNDLTFSPLGKKLHSGELLAQEVPDSQTQIYRYIRLNELNEGLLNLADEGRIGIRPAVELSYLKKEEQDALLETISYEDATPSLAQSIKMRKFSSEGKTSWKHSRRKSAKAACPVRHFFAVWQMMFRSRKALTPMWADSLWRCAASEPM